MGDDPGAEFATAAVLFIRPYPAVPAPLPHCELGPAEELCHLFGRVPVLDRLPLDQEGKRRLDPIKPRQNDADVLVCHCCPLLSLRPPVGGVFLDRMAGVAGLSTRFRTS